jgi:hypothetical protein
MIERKIVSKWSLFSWFDFFKPLKILFKFLDHFFNFEWYLTVIVLEKE